MHESDWVEELEKKNSRFCWFKKAKAKIREKCKAFRFRYVKAIVFSAIATIVCTIVIFHLPVGSPVQSFVIGISTGCITGFVFFLISGSKEYDINVLNAKKDFIEETYSSLEKICKDSETAYQNEKIEYRYANDILWTYRLLYPRLQTTLCHKKISSKAKENLNSLKGNLETMEDVFGRKNMNQWNEEIEKEAAELVRGAYKSSYLLLQDVSREYQSVTDDITRFHGMIF